MERSLHTEFKDIETMQLIAHKHGMETFIKLVVEAMYRASEDMEHIDRDKADQYRLTATLIYDELC